jgi:hypothetical protein
MKIKSSFLFSKDCTNIKVPNTTDALESSCTPSISHLFTRKTEDLVSLMAEKDEDTDANTDVWIVIFIFHT